MPEFGYFLSSEEHGPGALLEQAQLAADAGIERVWISDHFHPWLDEQGESPFVWSVIGAIGAATDLTVTTAVTCPTVRTHPAVIAQAAATSALLLDGRFELGVGSGEALNEQVLGGRWPPTDVRLDMLEEAVDVIRQLWTGEQVSHEGTHYRVENARLYSVPDSPPPIPVSGFGPKATDLAASIGDGYLSASPNGELVTRYREAGGKGLAQGAIKVCWGPDRAECVERAHRLWRNTAVPGELAQELRSPAHFDQAAELVEPEMVAEKIPCGPELEPIMDSFREYLDAGFDRVYINQIGPDQEPFFRFYESELGPALAELS
jgi:G6PDH family F420-dependent oxidoreductase